MSDILKRADGRFESCNEHGEPNVETSLKHSIDQMVINWHVNETCNYRCVYCYAKWERPPSVRDVIRQPENTANLLRSLWAFFDPANLKNPLKDTLTWRRVRLNFAGGEPLLCRADLIRAVELAAQIGFDVSIITNGSRLDSETMSALAPHLDWLGVSLDAADMRTNKAIGREDRRSRQLDPEALRDSVATARSNNPDLKLKINTVVSSQNHEADLTRVIARLSPHKWKILRALPMTTTAGMVTDEQFRAFVHRHRSLTDIIRVEDNADMLKSYLMIDPKGRFFQNHNDALKEGYRYSRPILDVGPGAALESAGFSAFGFANRYR
ncbi:viperin family antiviral radical SAM protein [Ruegeria sp. HKCCD7559]|uniref:viperin family antiviral radical SAM protein n=1 Tax=Ruegeria sp. HKCCD7559 TaxID=2683005 RepID=UPI001490B25C|nr:viperin family antiviral radical SAM protein [Ruegeria sp. HKCCD7559]NOC45731.1 radical SAM protein [Ruegeria sp. HKCCD7559]